MFIIYMAYKVAEDIAEYILTILEDAKDLEEAKREVRKLIGRLKERKFTEMERELLGY